MTQSLPMTPALDKMLQTLKDLPEVSSLKAGLILIQADEKPVGLGNRRGLEAIGPFGVQELKGIRIAARVKFQLLAKVKLKVLDNNNSLVQALVTHRNSLRESGFLEMYQNQNQFPEYVERSKKWQTLIEYSVLFEYQYQDFDGALGLIAQIPLTSQLEAQAVLSEHNQLQGRLVRWSKDQTPSLSLRGPRSINTLALLVSRPLTSASAQVTLERGQLGGTVVPSPDMNAFIGLAQPLDPTVLHRLQLSFGAFTAPFLNLTPKVTLAVDNTLVADYQPMTLKLNSPWQLASTRDVLNISVDAMPPACALYLMAD